MPDPADPRGTLPFVPFDFAAYGRSRDLTEKDLEGFDTDPRAVADDPSGIVQQMPEFVILPDPKRDLDELAVLRAEVERLRGILRTIVSHCQNAKDDCRSGKPVSAYNLASGILGQIGADVAALSPETDGGQDAPADS